MQQDFKQFQMRVYEEIKRLFPEGAVDVLVARAQGPGSSEPLSPAVRLVHRASGITVDCDEFPLQVQNRIVATLRLKIACDEKNA